MSGKGIRKNRWNEQEDEILRKMIEQHGARNWNLIARSIPGRNGKQCRERWAIFLDPSVSKEQWTKEEDNILRNCQAKFGNKWAFFMNHLPGRSCVAIRNRWTHLCRVGQATSESSDSDDVKPQDPNQDGNTVMANWSVIDQLFGDTNDIFGSDSNFDLFRDLASLYE